MTTDEILDELFVRLDVGHGLVGRKARACVVAYLVRQAGQEARDLPTLPGLMDSARSVPICDQ